MTVTGELTHPPVLIPATVGLKSRAVHAVEAYRPQAAWRHRIYRIPSPISTEDFVYGADGHKCMKSCQGEHVDLYA